MEVILVATFTNKATLSYSGGIVNSNITTAELVEVLTATKTAVVEDYSLNSQITYAINIINSGNVAFSGLTITDNLGNYTFGATVLQPLDYVDGSVKYFVDGVLQATPTVTATSPLTVTGINVPAGGTATVLYTVQVNSCALTCVRIRYTRENTVHTLPDHIHSIHLFFSLFRLFSVMRLYSVGLMPVSRRNTRRK